MHRSVSDYSFVESITTESNASSMPSEYSDAETNFNDSSSINWDQDCSSKNSISQTNDSNTNAGSESSTKPEEVKIDSSVISSKVEDKTAKIETRSVSSFNSNSTVQEDSVLNENTSQYLSEIEVAQNSIKSAIRNLMESSKVIDELFQLRKDKDNHIIEIQSLHKQLHEERRLTREALLEKRQAEKKLEQTESQLSKVKSTQIGIQRALDRERRENAILKNQIGTFELESMKWNQMARLKNKTCKDEIMNLRKLMQICEDNDYGYSFGLVDKYGDFKVERLPPDLSKLPDDDFIAFIDKLKSNKIRLDENITLGTSLVLTSILCDSRMNDNIGKVLKNQVYDKLFPKSQGSIAFTKLALSKYGSKLIADFFLETDRNKTADYVDNMLKVITKDPFKFCADQFGSFVVEKVISTVEHSQYKHIQKIIEKILRRDIVQSCTNQCYTRVIQEIIKCSKKYRCMIAEKLKTKYHKVATDTRGCFVAHGLLEHLDKSEISKYLLPILTDETEVKYLGRTSSGKSFISKLSERSQTPVKY